MSNEMTHKQRIDGVLRGDPIDRPPVSAWRHFYERENTKDDLVKSMLDFQRKFEWDFVKINSRASYHVEDWGVRFKYSDNPMAKPVAEYFPINKPSDWERIKPLDWKTGSLGEILAAGMEILSQAGSEVYCVPTIFSPLSIAADLVESDEKFIELLDKDPDRLHAALEAITTTFEGYVGEFIRAGMAGIFFATTEWASRERLTEEQYLEFGRPYDLRVLEKASDGFFNIMHVCKTNNMLPLFRDYPAPVISWNPFEEGNLQIGEAAQIMDRIFLTGADQNDTLLTGSENEIVTQIHNSLDSAPSGKMIVAPGCAVKVETPDNHMFAMADAVKGWKK